MVEILLAAGFFALMGGGVVALGLPASTWIAAGVWLVGLGLALGLPTGLAYHVLLHRAVREVGGLPPGWWWNPTAYHDRIPARHRRRVLAWCGAGALGFVVVVAGCVVTAIGVLRTL
jgi:hypothetical protein